MWSSWALEYRSLPEVGVTTLHVNGISANLIIVPDFRSSTGLFNTLRSEHKLKASGKHLFDASVYQTDSSTSSFHDMVRSLSQLVSVAKPTAFHQMLSALANEGRLMRLYTQNVDGIDVALPSLETDVPLSMKGPWPRTIQLHGGLEKMVCSKCNHLSDFKAALFDGPEPPLCTICIETDKVRTDHAGKRSHGIGKLRPRIVLYNEHNPDEDAIGAVVASDLRSRPDAVIVVGTSMKIPGVKRIVREMCGVVRGRRDGLTVWINHEQPPVGKEFEDCWDLVVTGACDEVARRWSNVKDSMNCTESEVERAKERTGEVKVVVKPPDSTDEPAQGILTPAASPLTKPSIPRITLKVKPSPLNLVPAQSTQKNSTSKAQSKTQKPAMKRPGRPKKGAVGSSVKPGVKGVSQKGHSKGIQKINTQFKVSKTNPKTTMDSCSKAKKKETGCCPLLAEEETPPSEIPSDDPLQSPVEPLFPNLPTEPGRWSRRNSDIVSPTGTIPKDMAKILN